MKTRSLLSAALLLVSSQIPSALAQVPSGAVTLSVPSSAAPIWDLSGTYTFSQQILMGGNVTGFSDLTYSLTITQNLRGMLVGSGIILVSIGESVVAANYTANGKLFGGGNSTSARLAVRITGQDAVAGINTRFNITLNYLLSVPATQPATAFATVEDGVITGVTVTSPGAGYVSAPQVTITDSTGIGANAVATISDAGQVTDVTVVTSGGNYSDTPVVTIDPPPLGDIAVTVQGVANFSRLGRGHINSDFSVPLPPGMDGSWTAYLNIIPLNHLSGSGTVVLANGNRMQMGLTGVFTDEAHVKMTGAGPARGNLLNLSFTDESTTPDFVSARMWGQVFSANLKRQTK